MGSKTQPHVSDPFLQSLPRLRPHSPEYHVLSCHIQLEVYLSRTREMERDNDSDPPKISETASAASYSTPLPALLMTLWRVLGDWWGFSLSLELGRWGLRQEVSWTVNALPGWQQATNPGSFLKPSHSKLSTPTYALLHELHICQAIIKSHFSPASWQ